MAETAERDDRELSALLAGLSDAELPAGFETRLRARLLTAPRRRRPAWLGYGLAVAAGACAALLLVSIPRVTRQAAVGRGGAVNGVSSLAVPRIGLAPAPKAGVAEPAAGGAAFSAAVPGPAAPLQPGGSFSTALPDLTQRMIIQQASISVRVADVQQAFGRIETLVAGMGGFVGQSSFTQGRSGPTAGLDVRVPAGSLSGFLNDVRQLGTVTSVTQSARDVTQQYVDVNARLRALQAEENTYLRLLSQAKTVQDTLQIQQALTQVRAQIESLQAQSQTLRHLSDLATVHVALEAAGRPVGALQASWRAFAAAATAAGLALVWLLPWAPLAAIVAAIVLAVRRRRIVR